MNCAARLRLLREMRNLFVARQRTVVVGRTCLLHGFSCLCYFIVCMNNKYPVTISMEFFSRCMSHRPLFLRPYSTYDVIVLASMFHENHPEKKRSTGRPDESPFATSPIERHSCQACLIMPQKRFQKQGCGPANSQGIVSVVDEASERMQLRTLQKSQPFTTPCPQRDGTMFEHLFRVDIHSLVTAKSSGSISVSGTVY